MRILAVALISILLCALPSRSMAFMKAMEEGDLAAISGRAGISVDLDLGMMVTMGGFSISDTSTPNWLALTGITVDDGSGGNFQIRTSQGTTITPTTFDLNTDASGQTSLTIYDTSRSNPRYYTIDSISLAAQELGGLRIGPVTEGPSTLILSALNGQSGLQFDYTSKVDIGSFRYNYSSNEALSLSGIHLAGSGSGVPEDPSSWVMSGNFHVGPGSSGDSKASYTVSADQNGVSFSALNIPIQGSIRAEDLSIGGTSFGPMAIDGISAHRLQMKFTP